jgi:hypothetical protein
MLQLANKHFPAVKRGCMNSGKGARPATIVTEQNINQLVDSLISFELTLY